MHKGSVYVNISLFQLYKYEAGIVQSVQRLAERPAFYPLGTMSFILGSKAAEK
jgi:hypothetical protein